MVVAVVVVLLVQTNQVLVAVQEGLELVEQEVIIHITEVLALQIPRQERLILALEVEVDILMEIQAIVVVVLKVVLE
tara:strand:- start:65 stop:295 length:231 start_codon:yes stop_codon:yes gene_type:complete